MSHSNLRVMTTSEILSHVAMTVGNADASDATLNGALRLTMDAFGDKLRSRFYLQLPIAHRSSRLDLSELGVNDVRNVWYVECYGAQVRAKWWEFKNHVLSLEPVHGYCIDSTQVLIEHWERPPSVLSPISGTLTAPFNYANASGGEMHVSVSSTDLIPPSGYVKVGDGSDAQWFEYQAVYLTDDPASNVLLMLAVKQPWAHQLGTAFSGETVEWGVGFRSSASLDALVKQTATYYWASKTGTCNSDEERDTAMQLMNFWSNEAERAWSNTNEANEVQAIRKSIPGETQWLYQ